MVTDSDPIMMHFPKENEYHDLGIVGSDVGMLAEKMDGWLPESAEKAAGMRKLLEAQDCFLRAAEMRGK